MPFKPGVLDYEGVFPIRRRRDDRSEVEESASSQKLKSIERDAITFDERRDVLTPGIAPQQAATSNKLIWPRSHAISFVCLFIFSVVLYVRPYEAIPALSSFKSMAFFTGLVTLVIFAATQLATEGNLTARPREINLVLLLGVAALLSMPMAVDPAAAWKTFSEMLVKTIVIFVVFVNVVRTERRLQLLLLLIIAVSLYLSANAINDYRLGLFKVGEMETQRIAGRIKGLFENSNDLALHLVTIFPIAVALGLSKRDPVRKLIYIGIAGVMVAAVVVTFSRGGFLGLLAAAFILIRRLGRKNRVATTSALVFAVIVFLALAPGAYSGRLSTIFNSAADVTMSSTQRTDILKRSIWVTLRYPLFGVGVGNFHYKSIHELETHNAYTQVGAEMGIAAMVCYILFLIHPLRRMRLVEKESYERPERRKFFYLSIGLQASLVGYMVSSFFGAVAYQWYVYYLVGYAVCLHRLFLIEHGSGTERQLWEHPFAKKRKPVVDSTQESAA